MADEARPAIRALVNIPPALRRGEPFEVRLLIGHPMETGQRADSSGTRIPRDIIRRVECKLDGEFVFSARLDNLGSCHAATAALAASTAPSPRTRLIALYDHEECGSKTAAGAAGSALQASVVASKAWTSLNLAQPDQPPMTSMVRGPAARPRWPLRASAHPRPSSAC